MALKNNFSLNCGVSFPDAYFRFRRVILDDPLLGEPCLLVDLEVYKDEDTRKAIKIPFAVLPYKLPAPEDKNGNLKAQAYVSLKRNVKEYKDAVDLL